MRCIWMPKDTTKVIAASDLAGLAVYTGWQIEDFMVELDSYRTIMVMRSSEDPTRKMTLTITSYKNEVMGVKLETEGVGDRSSVVDFCIESKDSSRLAINDPYVSLECGILDGGNSLDLRKLALQNPEEANYYFVAEYDVCSQDRINPKLDKLRLIISKTSEFLRNAEILDNIIEFTRSDDNPNVFVATLMDQEDATIIFEDGKMKVQQNRVFDVFEINLEDGGDNTWALLVNSPNRVGTTFPDSILRADVDRFINELVSVCKTIILNLNSMPKDK